MLRHITLLMACLITPTFAATDQGGARMPEIRAMWVARWDITSPEACRTLVKLAREHEFNTLIVQVRGRGDALYKSAYEPRCQFLDDQPADFDPLGVILEEAKKAGIEVHAWINANYTWDSKTPPVSPEHIVNKHPEWLMRTNQNETTMTGGEDVEGAYTCPTNEAFREFLKNIYLDVATHYDVAGVHFDFIRYPSPRYCYCDRCLAMFRSEMDAEITPERRKEIANSTDRIAYPLAFPKQWDRFRREQITKIVYTVYDAVKAVRPRMAVSASVFPDYGDAFSHRFQDWKRWMKDGKVDVLFPMAYSKTTERFVELIQDAVSSSGKTPVVAGIGSWQIPADSTIEKIKKARELGAAGFCLFSYSVTDKGKKPDYLRAVREGINHGSTEEKGESRNPER